MSNTAAYNKAPPALKNCKSYLDWKKLINIWAKVTSLDATKQASAIVLSLEGEAQEAALEIEDTKLSSATGLKEITERLDKIYLKDALAEKYNALENFESYRRPSSTSIREFLVEFDKRYFKVKSHQIIIPEDLLGYRLLKASNLDSHNEQLVKATLSELKFDEVKSKLIKIFSDDSTIPSTSQEIPVKQEVLHAQHSDQRNAEHDEEDYRNEEDFQEYEDENDTYFANSRRNSRPSNNSRSQNWQRGRSSWKANQQRPRSSADSANNWRSNRSNERPPASKAPRNPTGRDGQVTRCDICESINHWAGNCPDKFKKDQETFVVHEIVLHGSHEESPEKMKELLSDTWSSGLLDCGATKTVCGRVWLNEYLNTLSDEQRCEVKYTPTQSVYRFGDGEQINASESVRIPACIGSAEIFIMTDIIDKDLPLLLSKAFMKRANIVLDFNNDSMLAFDQEIPLNTSNTGHYVIYLSKPSQILHKIDDPSTHVTLKCNNSLDNKQMALKLHRQFCHPSKEKLTSLVSKAGKPWCDNKDLINEITNVSNNCQVCMKYKKSPPRPAIGFPMASTFMETVALDLKYYNGHWLLHMIDLCTRLSSAKRIPNKKPETIIKAIFEIWLQVWGSPEKFLVDNGGEFANSHFVDLAERFGIRVMTTAAYSPWSNGTVERHNGILAEMLDKLLDDNKLDIDIAIAWCINSKNSLASVNGFSPYQLSIGRNPRLPSLLNDQIPALTADDASKVIQTNLNMLHKAREAFIAAENSERLRRALSHNIRTSGEIRYFAGDNVYYKREGNRAWHGPCRVIGQDGKQVLLKHGSYYVRVHPCRLQLIDRSVDGTESTLNKDAILPLPPTDHISPEIEVRTRKEVGTKSRCELPDRARSVCLGTPSNLDPLMPQSDSSGVTKDFSAQPFSKLRTSIDGDEDDDFVTIGNLKETVHDVSNNTDDNGESDIDAVELHDNTGSDFNHESDIVDESESNELDVETPENESLDELNDTTDPHNISSAMSDLC